MHAACTEYKYGLPGTHASTVCDMWIKVHSIVKLCEEEMKYAYQIDIKCNAMCILL